MSDNIYKRVANHVTGLFEKHPNPNLLYHSLTHTKKVVERAQEIAAHYQVSENDNLIVSVAAWFHDTGHLFTDVEKHEEKGIELMYEYMQNEKDVTKETLTAIAHCITVTGLSTKPQNRVEEIICDADTYHFGTKEFKKTNKLIKKEYALRGYDTLILDWYNNSIELLEKHQFYTTYCKVLLDLRKKKNIEWLKGKEQKNFVDNTHHGFFDNGNGVKASGQSGKLLTRGIQTVMRLTSSNHFQLSEMADRKANILITVNAIMITILLSLFGAALQDYPHFIIPVVILLVVLLATIILAIMATRPKVTEGTFNKDDVLSKKTNLLFFGNFATWSLEEYQWAMSILMKDTEYIYLALVNDIYQMGHVLGKKYKLLRFAYNIFMFGLILSVIAFTITYFINSTHGNHPAGITTGTGSPL
ncbi:MAG: metal-dependent phosphohydrolase sub domain protein [Flavipsychrobacter sp.]|jgi:predicted metal-dependent HD superfamily phosphohydrolase|nr:metal-dependent phosphohydrolase sub domain protein [Flavipsychrobacter sp.]